MTNPKTAVDAILDSENKIDGITIYPMTLARYALLELVESPFVTPNVKFSISNLVPSFFICCSSIDQLKGINSKNIDQLNDRALEWAETLPQTAIDKLIPAIMESLGLINKLTPQNGEDQSKKAAAELRRMDG